MLGLLGGGSASPAADYVIEAATLAIAMGLVFLWVARRGGGAGAAAVTTAVVALSPAAVFIALGVFSEPLYLALSFGGFVALSAPCGGARRWHGAALLFGLSALARSAGLFAVAAFLVHWFVQTRGRRHRFAPVIALLPPAGWAAVKWSQGWTESYIGSMFEDGATGALANAFEQAQINVPALWYHFVRCFDLLGSTYVSATSVLLLALAAYTCAGRLRRGEPDALYVIVYLAVIVVWPYPNHMRRFLLMILPFVVAYAIGGGVELAARTRSAWLPRLARWATSAIVIMMVVPSTLFFTTQIRQYAGTADAEKPRIAAWYGRDSQAESLAAVEFGGRLLDAIGGVREHVPDDACVTSTMPEFVQLHARRRSLRPPRPGPGNRDILRHAAQCPYILMLRAALFPSTNYPFYYPLRELQPQLTLLHSVPLDEDDPGGEPLLILARFTAAAAERDEQKPEDDGPVRGPSTR